MSKSRDKSCIRKEPWSSECGHEIMSGIPKVCNHSIMAMTSSSITKVTVMSISSPSVRAKQVRKNEQPCS